MGYNLPDHELFILNREYGISYRKLAEGWNCGQSTIGNHVRQFEECLDSGDVDAIDLYEVTSMKLHEKDYQNMIEDMKMEQSDNYTDEMEQLIGIPDVAKGSRGGNDKTATEVMNEGIMPWYKRLYDWLKWW